MPDSPTFKLCLLEVWHNQHPIVCYLFFSHPVEDTFLGTEHLSGGPKVGPRPGGPGGPMSDGAPAGRGIPPPSGRAAPPPGGRGRAGPPPGKNVDALGISG